MVLLTRALRYPAPTPSQAYLDGQLTSIVVPHGAGPASTVHVQIPA